MAKGNAAKIEPGDGDAVALISPQPIPRQEISQTTLSTVGDVSIAATASLSRAASAMDLMNWLPIFGFFFVVYVATCLANLLSFQLDPWVLTFLTPLVPVLPATAAFWARQRSKRQARDERFKSELWKNALGSLSHEVASAANVMRANLTGYRLAHPEASESDLLNAMERATARVD